jgi:hypothetical protein
MKSFVIFRHVPIPKLLGFGSVLGSGDLGFGSVLGLGVLGNFGFGFGFRFFPQIMILINKKNTIAC